MIHNSSAIASHAELPATSGKAPNALSPANYQFLQRYIYAESGIVIDLDKQYLLESRLAPVMRLNSIESLDALTAILIRKSSLQIAKQVIEAMTTNETLFFRDPAMFEALRTDVIPGHVEQIKGTRKLRIWSAAASTGQEAYSIAMLMLEMGRGRFDTEIIGTDLSSQVLERAREGTYVPFEVGRGLPARYLTKYFERKNLDWQVRSEVREMVRFEQLDLRQASANMGQFDVILCRNVLIYFDTPTKTKIVSSLRSLLAPGGHLVLGCAETVLNLNADFRRTAIGQTTFYSI